MVHYTSLEKEPISTKQCFLLQIGSGSDTVVVHGPIRHK